jgi:hypothetical protein
MKPLLRSVFFVATGVVVVATIRAAKSRHDKNRAQDLSTPKTGGPGHDDIASRAYFIGLEHERRGEPHDASADWAQAETELVGVDDGRPA